MIAKVSKAALAMIAVGLISSTYACSRHRTPPQKKVTKDAGKQTTCPVMGGKINKALYADADGKRIYVCCKGCISAVKKDPAKYIKMIKDNGQQPSDIPSK